MARPGFSARPGFLFLFAAIDEHPQVSDAVLATYVRLCRVAARELAGGRFIASKPWTSSAWERLAGVRLRAVLAVVAAGLALWDGDDLVLEHYDRQGEDRWRRCSEAGTLGNRLRWGNRGAISGGDQSAGRPPIKGATQQSESPPDSRRESAEHSIAEKNRTPPPVRADPAVTDPRLAAAAACGVYLDFRGEDQRPAWVAEFDRLAATPDAIAVVLREQRLPDGGTIRLPSGFAKAWDAWEAKIENRSADEQERVRRREQMTRVRAALDGHAQLPDERKAKVPAMAITYLTNALQRGRLIELDESSLRCVEGHLAQGASA
jgi:hypothetical protein